ncbi:hypothetical protein JHK84_035278 [Glycine max]|nr:hypothetical protein JHK84_035278 [Glycine max]
MGKAIAVEPESSPPIYHPTVFPPDVANIIGRKSQYLTVEPPRGRQIWRMSIQDDKNHTPTNTTQEDQFVIHDLSDCTDDDVNMTQENMDIAQTGLHRTVSSTICTTLLDSLDELDPVLNKCTTQLLLLLMPGDEVVLYYLFDDHAWELLIRKDIEWDNNDINFDD